MVRAILARPGVTDYDLQGRIQGNLDIPLCAEGRAAAVQCAEELRSFQPKCVYAPESEPAWQTADLLAETLGCRLRKIDRLENINLGLWQGMLIAEVRLKQPRVYRQWQEQPETVCPPEGEMLEEADDRLRAALVKLLRRHKESDTIAVVLPEPLFSLARRFLAQAELGDLWTAGKDQPLFEIYSVEVENLLSGSTS